MGLHILQVPDLTPALPGLHALTPALAALQIADPPERWRALGFAVRAGARVRDGARVHLGGVELRLGADGDRRGITAWAVTGAPGLALLPTIEPPEPALPRSDTHPNQARELDHVVITTPDFDATADALHQAGLGLRRVRQATPEMRQGFRRLGPAIIEVVEARQTQAPATVTPAAGLSTRVAFMDPG